MASEEPKVIESPLFDLLDRLTPPPELRPVSEAALARILDMGGLPKKKAEMYTFANIGPHLEPGFTPRYGAPAGAGERAQAAVFEECKNSFAALVDAEWRPELSDLSAVARDVTVTPLLRHAATPGGLERLVEAAKGENDFPACLNNAFGAGGIVLSVRPGARLSSPLMVLVFSTGGGRVPATFPRLVIDIGKEAEAVLLVKYAGAADGYQVNALTGISLGEKAVLNWSQIQADPPGAVHFSKVRAEIGTGARCNAVNASTGGRMTRHHYECHLNGEGAELFLGGVSVLDGTSEAHNYVRVHHTAPGCTSRQLFRNIVAGASHSSVDTTVIVHPGARLTDSNQLVNNLMLSPRARANTKPNLTIRADDVKCTHGATAGRLDEEQVFYLKSRCIAEARARALLTTSFAETVFGRMPHPRAARDAREMLMKKLEGLDFGAK